MEKQEFYAKLKNALIDGKNRYYRNLVYIEKEDYMQDLFEIIKTYLEVNNSPSVLYAFHPWVKYAKDRRDEVKKLFSSQFEDVDYSSSENYLGNTYDLVILDLVDNFQPNYIGRLVDLARGGGLIILYTNNLTFNKLFRNSIVRNNSISDIYERRFKRKLYEHQGIFIIDNNSFEAKVFTGNVKKPEKIIPSKILMPKELHELTISQDQSKALDGIKYIIRGGKRLVAITAPRGRGKSAVTGLGLAGIIKENLEDNFESNIIVTAPSIASSSQIMEFAKKGLQSLNIEFTELKSDLGFTRSIEGKKFRIIYKPPDAAVESNGNLIVVDEAAAIGMSFLSHVLRKWRKIILVTTIHGYEGTGKAFLRYLTNLIKEKKIPVNWITMEKPLRYSEGDPVESWLYDALVLNADINPIPKDIKIAEYETLNKEELFNQDEKLRQVYGILVTAHYRNNPDDLMIMADGNHHLIKTISVCDGKYYIAVTQVSEEGELSDELIDTALKGGTFDGDLIPDRILKHARIRDFGKLKGWRIVRIAVTPEFQGRGFGSKLLELISANADVDWIGSSFMGDPKVLNFWIKNNFIPVHVSPRRNEKFGDFPVIVIKPISEKAEKIVNIISLIFKERLLQTLHDIYFDMSPQLARLLLKGNHATKNFEINKIYIAKALAFLQGASPYEASADSIHLLTLKYFWSNDQFLDPEEEIILIGKVLQGKPWGVISSETGINRTTMSEFIYSAISKIIKKYYNLSPESQINITLENLGDEFTTR
ncbi:GNAT family N-acetyltransferase [Acidianus sulfidivorans JP7]|uniref:tRNA(Met) cytidine acetyltransferase TmcA n=1 Tax=Acidianus sulfidivorans JP7 TaxID=619593 RepID=A0A2U9IN84_9CREN|nr:tRNA(Met) cytidine acetyltransferase TmcA [Acidianus sulfidivorans]AWR97529.1 GNAT family N-acetyltransferase [Acidianus sulfidivorans JP7]